MSFLIIIRIISLGSGIDQIVKDEVVLLLTVNTGQLSTQSLTVSSTLPNLIISRQQLVTVTTETLPAS